MVLSFGIHVTWRRVVGHLCPSAYNPSSNGVVEAGVRDVKLAVPDILGQVSFCFDFRLGVGKKLLVPQKGLDVPR